MEKWNGFDIEEFVFEEHAALIVYPAPENKNGYLAVKTEYWNAFPEAAEIELLNRGFHLCFIKNDNRLGMNYDLDRKARFVRFVADKCGLKDKCVPVGMSCGGLIAIKFAARYPELIACLYVDAPVVNYVSWPLKAGKTRFSATEEEILAAHKEAISSLGVRSIAEVMTYRETPFDKIPDLISARLPMIMVSGDADTVVPYDENGIFVERAYKDAGVDIEVHIKPGGDHHPHGLPTPDAVVNFIMKYCK